MFASSNRYMTHWTVVRLFKFSMQGLNTQFKAFCSNVCLEWVFLWLEDMFLVFKRFGERRVSRVILYLHEINRAPLPISSTCLCKLLVWNLLRKSTFRNSAEFSIADENCHPCTRWKTQILYMPHLWFANSSPFQAIGHTCLIGLCGPTELLEPACFNNYQIADVNNLNCLLKKISMNTITYQTTLSRPFCFLCFFFCGKKRFSKDKRGSLRKFTYYFSYLK